MPCKVICPPKIKLCASSLRNSIQIQTRAIATIALANPDYTEEFTTIKTVRAAIVTKRGFRSFNSVGLTQDRILNNTHQVYIRYSAMFNIVSEDWLLFNSERYTIKDVENIDERNQWWLLLCIKKGDDTKLANFS